MNEIAHVHLPDAPAIAGLGFQRLRDGADYSGLAAVREGSVQHDQIDMQSPREGLPTADDLADLFPLAELRGHPDFLVVTKDDRIIGYAHVLWRWTEITGERVYLHLGHLLPEWRGHGIDSAMLRWSQARIREMATTEPHELATFATNVSSTEHEAARLMNEEGYAVVRQLSDMALDLATPIIPPLLPAGVARRLLVPDQFRPVYHAWKDAFSLVWTSTPPSEEDFEEFVQDNFAGSSFDPGLCEIGWSGDEVAGLVLCRVHNGVGVIAEVAVRPRWQRRGIARALLLETLRTLQRQGIPQARLFTDAHDHQGARSLYEQLGFQESKQHSFYRKPL